MSGIEPETSSLPRTRSADCATWAHSRDLERETGFEPATPSLEGWRSTAELFPPERRTTCAFLNRVSIAAPRTLSTAEPRVPLVVAPCSAHPRWKPTSRYPLQ